MARRQVITSDLTGKDVEDHVEISIKSNGHGVKIGNNTYFGDTVLDVDVKEVSSLMQGMSFVKSSPTMLRASSEPLVEATAQFFSPGGNSPKPREISAVEPSSTQQDAPDYMETK